VNDTKEDITRIILNYLRRNPDKSNPLEDISRRRLFEKIDVTVDEVSRVLETLIKEGKVKRQVVNGNNSIYKICEEV